MARSQKKSLFLRREKDAWDYLAEERRLHEGLAKQLAAARQEVAELTSIDQELVDLRARKKKARKDANRAEGKLAALIEKECTDTEEAERVLKERDELFQAMKGLHAEHDMAHQERTEAQQCIALLKHDLDNERKLKV